MAAKIKIGFSAQIEQMYRQMQLKKEARQCDPANPKKIPYYQFKEWIERQLNLVPSIVFRLRNFEDRIQEITPKEKDYHDFDIEHPRWEEDVNDSNSIIYHGDGSSVECSETNLTDVECSETDLTDEESNFDDMMKMTTEIFARSVNTRIKINRSNSF